MSSAPAIAVERSDNSKIGPASATHQSQASCPRSCPLFGNGCYSESGAQSFTTQRLNKATETDQDRIADAHAAAIDTLTGKLDLRIDVVGDCATDYAAQAVAQAAKRHMAKHGKQVWSYTHAWRDVSRASWGSVSVLASCETSDALTAAKVAGYATALVYVADNAADKPFTVDGHKVVPCPEQNGKAANCVSCRLCFDDGELRERELTIGFVVHGAQKKKAASAVKGAM